MGAKTVIGPWTRLVMLRPEISVLCGQQKDIATCQRDLSEQSPLAAQSIISFGRGAQVNSIQAISRGRIVPGAGLMGRDWTCPIIEQSTDRRCLCACMHA